MAIDSNRHELRTRLPALGRIGLVLASIGVSVVSYRLLPSTVRIRWMIGTYQHYGPTHAPTAFVLVGFPVLMLGLHLGARWISSQFENIDEIEETDQFRFVYECCVLLTLSGCVAVQLLVIALNL